MKHFLIACGGTGGHLAPGIALAEGLSRRGHRATLLVSRKRIDARLLEKYPQLETVALPGAPFTLRPPGFLRFLWEQARGFFRCRRLVRAVRPAAIVGFGGWTTAAVVLAGALHGVPIVLHEANRVPGRAIRLLGRLAWRVYLPPEVALPGVRPEALRFAGLPVRAEMVRRPRAGACAALGLDPACRILVVLGGSQGAASLNAWARQDLADLAAVGIQVCCITGPDRADATPQVHPGQVFPGQQSGPAAVSPAPVFLPFSDDVAGLLSAADLVVSRAGAGTLAELARCRAPAILLPYPFAADDHQRANAAWFARKDGGLVLDQTRLGELSGLVRGLIFDDIRLRAFQAALARLDRDDAVGQMVGDLESLDPASPPLPSAPAPADLS
jgi:UDP-N-acetylglucosamine--N-acetylmuramyl-(pentapeptide) pyrophosphoryl-undecaprenol N-acetylglucosamine transferase